MMDPPHRRKHQNSKLALIAGLLIGLSLGAGAAWTASTTIHDAQFKVLDAVNKDLHRQVTALEADKTANEAEMTRLREQLSLLSPQRREVEPKRKTELERFIQRVDKELRSRGSNGGVQHRLAGHVIRKRGKLSYRKGRDPDVRR